MRRWLAGAAAVLFLAPYLGLALPFQPGLVFQALLLVVVLVVLGWSGRSGLFGRVRSLPRPVLWGLGLWAGAAAWGAAVGMLAGNPLRYVASQTLAMALLVVAALAFRAHPEFGGEELAKGLAAAAALALIVHLVGGRVDALRPTSPLEGFRFLLRNNVGVPGATVLAFLVLLARLVHGRPPWRLTLGLGAAALLLVGGMSRGSWVAAGLGSMALLVLLPERRRVLVPVLAGALLVVAALGWLATVSIDRGATVLETSGFEPGETSQAPARRVEIDPEEAFRGRSSLRLQPGTREQSRAPLAWNLPLHSHLLEVDIWTRGRSGDRLTLSAVFLDGEMKSLGRRQVLVPGQGDWTRFRWLVFAPRPSSRLRIWANAGRAAGAWRLDDLSIRELPSSWAAPVYQVVWRGASALRGASQPRRDGGTAYRLAELRSVWSTWSRASVPAILAGQGLGATFRFQNFTWDAAGRRVMAPKASYIHNFYVFLAFKLGLAGVAGLAGLLSIATWSWVGAVRQRFRPGSARRWLLAGAAASWAAYLVWSVTSPEIYSFHTAPLWGALVAACGNEWDREDP